MKAYLIPGAFEDLKDRNYQSVLDAYKDAGYEPKFIIIDWKYKTIDDWVEQVRTKIPKQDLKNSLLSGFSWGAMIAFTVAAKYTNPKGLLLHDLSPYFAEDLPRVKQSWLKWAGKKRLENFKQLQAMELAKHINCPTVLFLGIGDRKGLIPISRRVNETNKVLKTSRIIRIKGVGHDVADPKYIAAIKNELR
jgi:pimeloyl-ACP methyl ester carboxylesterase